METHFWHVSAGLFTPDTPLEGKAVHLPLGIKLVLFSILQKHYSKHCCRIRRVRTFYLYTLWLKNLCNLLKTRNKLSNIEKSCKSDFCVWKSVYFFQCKFLHNIKNQFANTNSLVPLLMR